MNDKPPFDEKDKTITAVVAFGWLAVLTIWAGFIVHDIGRIADALDRAYPIVEAKQEPRP